MSKLTKAEQETVIRYDRSEPILHLWTASPAEFRKLKRRGWPLVAIGVGWAAKVPIRAVSFRRLPIKARRGKPEVYGPRDLAILGGDPSL